MSVAVRAAKFSDIPAITELAREAWQRSIHAKDDMNIRRFKDTCFAIISNSSGNPACLFVAERDGGIVGFLMGITDWLYVFSKNRYATDLLFYVAEGHEGAGLPLARAFDAWWRGLDPKYRVVAAWPGVTMAISKDFLRTGKIWERLGYRLGGGIWMKRLDEED